MKRAPKTKCIACVGVGRIPSVPVSLPCPECRGTGIVVPEVWEEQRERILS